MFIPRHPVVENQFCQFYGQTTVSGGAGDVLAYAGSACYLDDSQNEPIVKIFVADESKECFGFLMQKVKTGYHSIHPPGFVLPGDLGLQTLLHSLDIIQMVRLTVRNLHLVVLLTWVFLTQYITGTTAAL